MEFRTLNPQELEAWYAHCQGVFQLDDANYFRNHYQQDPFADPSLIFVAMDGDTIAATVRVFRREVWLQGRAVKMGGIGEVSTKPEYRRRGLVSTLLEHAIAAMVAEGMSVSILFGNQAIYEKAGWRFCEMPRARVGTGTLTPLPEICTVRPFEMSDLPALMGMYDLYAGRLDGAVLRNEAYWRRWVLPQWINPQVLLADGQPVAYCCAKSGGEGMLETLELCAAPQGEALLPGMLRSVAENTQCDSIRYPTSLVAIAGAENAPIGKRMMVRLNIPLGEIGDSDALVAHMRNAGMFDADYF